VELLSQLTWVDLALIAILAVGVFVGFTQGMIRYILNGIGVLVAFVLAAQLAVPLVDLLGFWEAFTPEGRQFLVFNVLFYGFVVAVFLVVRAAYKRGRMPIMRQLDEIGGAIFGLLWVVLIICFGLIIMDSFFDGGGQTGGWVASLYDALNDSVIIQFFRDAILPIVGFLVRPFVPEDLTEFIPLP
jgi:uncharacterized membrane protein required for colicin V production